MHPRRLSQFPQDGLADGLETILAMENGHLTVERYGKIRTYLTQVGD